MSRRTLCRPVLPDLTLAAEWRRRGVLILRR